MSLTYKQAGVDIAAGNHFVQQIKPLAASTHNTQVLGGLGGFGALFQLNISNYKEPVLVSATDGVGSKLQFTLQANNYKTIGIDLVAMCVNDVIASGATPLFFLDYYATAKLDTTHGTQLIESIVAGCQQANIALIGGETAEMPSVYEKGGYDLAGFCVGIIEKSHLISSQQVQPGDQLIALASSGFHANGYSLIHAILKQKKIPLDTQLANKTLIQHLLTPTKIYTNTLQSLQANHIPIHGIAHITGGGIIENLPRILPENLQANLNTQQLNMPPLFQWLQNIGNLSTEEMRNVFNCGIGMILCIPKQHIDTCLMTLEQIEEIAWPIGEIIPKTHLPLPSIVFNNQ